MAEIPVAHQGESGDVPRITLHVYGASEERLCEVVSYDIDGEYEGSVVLDKQEARALIAKFTEIFDLTEG